MSHICRMPRIGLAYVDKWMTEHCCLNLVDDKYEGAIAAFLKFKEQRRGFPGQECLDLGF